MAVPLLFMALAPIFATLQEPLPEPPADPVHAVAPGRRGSSAQPGQAQPGQAQPGQAQPGQAQPGQEPPRLPVLDDSLARMDLLPGDALWAAWVRRDARVSFNRHAAVLADRVLRDEEAAPEERACADLVLALINGGAARPYLARRAAEASGLERRAAVLALGETGVGVEPTLFALVDDPEVGDCAVLGLARLSQGAIDTILLDLVQRGDHPLSEVADKLMVFASVPEKSVPAAASALLLNLRWHAARLFGQVDGQVWRVFVNERLLKDRTFVKEAVLRSAGRLRHPGVADQVLELLLEDDTPVRLRAAVACLPYELSTIVRLGNEAAKVGQNAEFWQPASVAEWEVLLDEIERRRLEFDTLDLLVVARGIPELAYRASALLSRTGMTGALAFDGEFVGASVGDKLWACEAMANTGAKRWLAVLEPLCTDPEVTVRAAARVAQVRLLSERARDEVADLLEGDDEPLRGAIVRTMCASARDPRIADWLDRLLRRAEGKEAVRIATALAAHGRLEARSQLRDLMRKDPPRGEAGAAIVRALARSSNADDAALLASLYPRADDREMNVALAVALMDAGSVEILPLVRSAIWDESGSVSILAAGILAERASPAALVDELAQPPVQATSEDIRRLGFALGVWGGMEEVAALARSMRYNSGHPAVQGAVLGALSQRTR